MRIRGLIAVPAVLAAAAVLLLGACADEPGGEPPTGPPTGTPTLPDPPTPPAPPPTVSPPRLPPTEPGGEATVTGEAVAGVEPGCVLLRTEHGEFLLFGPAADDVQVGETATVRGQVRPDMASTCQQGVPFEVEAVVD